MRIATLALLAALPATLYGCIGSDDGDDLGRIVSGKGDASLIDKQITIPARDDNGPGEKKFTVHASTDFDVTLTYDGDAAAKISVTNADTDKKDASEITPQPQVSVSAGGGGEHTFHITVGNYSGADLSARIVATGHGGGAVSAELLAAARANLERVTKEIDGQHLASYNLQGTNVEQFMTALASEYEQQHGDQYAARVKALASMVFFALPDVKPPTGGNLTPFHGLDMDQFNAMIGVEDNVFSELINQNGGRTNGVRPFSVCETKFIVETYVRPRQAYPGFDAYKAAYQTFADSCDQKDKDEWYNFRGLGGLRPSWVESNLADRFLRRMVKNCQHPSNAWKADCELWTKDRFGYRQLRNRQLAARTLYYAPSQESYVIDPNNPLVFLEDRTGDGVGEFLRPGAVKLKSGEQGTLQVNSTSQFAGELKYQGADGMLRTVSPGELVAEDEVDSRYTSSLLDSGDMGLMTVFSDSSGCTGASLDPAQCPLMRRFYSMIDRHENFYQTFSALTPTFYGVSSQPSPLVACSITLGASHQWDTAGTPPGGTAGFIFLMRIPFADVLTGNDVSVATLMPGPKTTSIQSLYAGTGGSTLDMSRAWLDVASLSNNQYANEHEISAFGAVPAGEIEGILVVRKPAGVQ